MENRFDLELCLPIFGVKFDPEDVSNEYMTRESEGITVEDLLEVIVYKTMGNTLTRNIPEDTKIGDRKNGKC